MGKRVQRSGQSHPSGGCTGLTCADPSAHYARSQSCQLLLFPSLCRILEWFKCQGFLTTNGGSDPGLRDVSVKREKHLSSSESSAGHPQVTAGGPGSTRTCHTPCSNSSLRATNARRTWDIGEAFLRDLMQAKR